MGDAAAGLADRRLFEAAGHFTVGRLAGAARERKGVNGQGPVGALPIEAEDVRRRNIHEGIHAALPFLIEQTHLVCRLGPAGELARQLLSGLIGVLPLERGQRQYPGLALLCAQLTLADLDGPVQRPPTVPPLDTVPL